MSLYAPDCAAALAASAKNESQPGDDNIERDFVGLKIVQYVLRPRVAAGPRRRQGVYRAVAVGA